MSSAAKPPILTVISKILESSNLVGTSEKAIRASVRVAFFYEIIRTPSL